MNKDECIQLLKKYMDILKGKYGITSLSLFGSTARGEQTANSDIDLFVDTETPNPFLLMDAKEFLEKLGVKYIYQFEAKDIGRYYDFAIILNNEMTTGNMLLIEIDGSYYHSDPRLVSEDKMSPMQKRNKRSRLLPRKHRSKPLRAIPPHYSMLH